MKVTFIKEVASNEKSDDIEVEIDATGGKHYLKHKTARFNSKAKTVTNTIDLNEQLKITQEEILKKIAQWLSEGSGWIIDKIENHYLNIIKYKPMKGKSYIQLPKEFRNPMTGLINIQSKDNECFRWCHIRHINPQDKYPKRIKKSDRSLINKLDYSGLDFPVKINDYNKIEKTEQYQN